MGHPRKQKRKYSRPLKPWDEARIEKEGRIMKEFGLKRKQEIWKAEAKLTGIRGLARSLRAQKNEKTEKEFLAKLDKMGLIENPTLDSVLNVKLEDILNRRLQTIVFRKGLSTTTKHARQLIAHGLVLVGERRLKWPSAMIPKSLEDKITLKVK